MYAAFYIVWNHPPPNAPRKTLTHTWVIHHITLYMSEKYFKKISILPDMAVSSLLLWCARWHPQKHCHIRTSKRKKSAFSLHTDMWMSVQSGLVSQHQHIYYRSGPWHSLPPPHKKETINIFTKAPFNELVLVYVLSVADSLWKTPYTSKTSVENIFLHLKKSMWKHSRQKKKIALWSMQKINLEKCDWLARKPQLLFLKKWNC